MSNHFFLDFPSFLLLFYCLFARLSNVATGLDASPLEAWELNAGVLTGNTMNPFSIYNGDSSYPECIFVFGGNACTDCNTLFCYNIETDTLSEFGTFDSSNSGSRYQHSQQNGFIISDGTDDLLYYMDISGNVYYYDLNDADSTEVLKTSIDATYPVLLKHPLDTEFYVIDGSSSGGEFYVYDLVENEIHEGNDLNHARTRPGAVVNDYDEDNPYVYVLGGASNYMERININDARNNKWEVLQLLLQNSISDQCNVAFGSYHAMAIVTYANFIYLIGGYDGSNENDIMALDVENWELTWAGVFPTGISRFSASVAEGRVYTFGGNTGSTIDDVYISNLLSEVTDENDCAACDDTSVMQTWKLSDATLTSNSRNPFAIWSGESSYPNCIFVFGGNVCTDCDTLFCYDIETDTLEEFGEFDSSNSGDRYFHSQQNGFIINDYLYYADIDGDVYYYDLNDADSTEVLKTSLDVTYPAMVKHPDETEFYVIDGNNGGEFYIYDLVENEIITGNDLNIARYRPGVVVNEYYDDAYIYVLSGASNYMERVNINDARNNEWQVLQFLLQNSISDQCSVAFGSLCCMPIISYANFIYLIGGNDGSNENDIMALDVENWELTWAGVFPTGISRFPATLAYDRVYTFGGNTGSDTDDIYISNSFDEVCNSSSNNDHEMPTTTKTATTQRVHEFHNNNNKQLANIDIKKDTATSQENDKNNNIMNMNNVYDIVCKISLLFNGIYICKCLFLKCKNNSFKIGKYNYQYQSI